jgi:hypothetical protein
MDKLRKIISEEFKGIFEADYDYAAAEREYADKEYYRQDMEAEISTGLSFMQDMKGSVKKLEIQKELKNTTPEVDGHIDEAITHINQAIESYFEGMDPDVKREILTRLGEVNL